MSSYYILTKILQWFSLASPIKFQTSWRRRSPSQEPVSVPSRSSLFARLQLYWTPLFFLFLELTKFLHAWGLSTSCSLSLECSSSRSLNDWLWFFQFSAWNATSSENIFQATPSERSCSCAVTVCHITFMHIVYFEEITPEKRCMYDTKKFFPKPLETQMLTSCPRHSLLFQWTFPTNMDILLHSRNATDKVGKWTWIHYCHFIVLLYSHCPMLSFITEGSTSEPWSIWLSLVASYWKGPSVSPWLSWPYYRPVFLEKVPQFWFVWRFPMIRFSCRSLTKISRKWSFCIPLPASSQVTCTWVWLHPLQVMCTLITWLRRCLPGFSTIKVLTSLCGL